MAWSDAARKAAAEVRRRHAEFRKQYPRADYRKERGWDIAAIYSRSQRKILAGDIRGYRRAIRSGKTKMDQSAASYLTSVLRSARVSTATRNYLKRR